MNASPWNLPHDHPVADKTIKSSNFAQSITVNYNTKNMMHMQIVVDSLKTQSVNFQADENVPDGYVRVYWSELSDCFNEMSLKDFITRIMRAL